VGGAAVGSGTRDKDLKLLDDVAGEHISPCPLPASDRATHPRRRRVVSGTGATFSVERRGESDCTPSGMDQDVVRHGERGQAIRLVRAGLPRQRLCLQTRQHADQPHSSDLQALNQLG
jgi:hypothetical protein